MEKNSSIKIITVYLRIAIATAYLWEVADRLGFLGAHGQPHIGWGDWAHFVAYAKDVMQFLPAPIVPTLALIATIGEGLFGLLLLLGLFTRWAAVGSGILSFCFAVAMAISFGIDSPLGYSVFTLSAASFLLAIQPTYAFSIDAIIKANRKTKQVDSSDDGLYRTADQYHPLSKGDRSFILAVLR